MHIAIYSYIHISHDKPWKIVGLECGNGQSYAVQECDMWNDWLDEPQPTQQAHLTQSNPIQSNPPNPPNPPIYALFTVIGRAPRMWMQFIFPLSAVYFPHTMC